MSIVATHSEWLAGVTKTGKPLPIEKVNFYRSQEGLPLLKVERTESTIGLRTSENYSPRLLPGESLKRILEEVGLSRLWCLGCEGRAAVMNQWGVQGCRDNFETIVAWMREAYRQLDWASWTAGVAKTVTTGLVFRVNPLDPCRSIVEEALRRSEESQKNQTQRAKMKWTYGLTTVPERRTTTLPRTLDSLKEAGFGEPRLFVDGADRLLTAYPSLNISYRTPRVGAYPNWMMSLYELYARDPLADMYAMFQDDFVTYRNLRSYLEQSPCPVDGYMNLYTFPSNQELAKTSGWYLSNQLGKGAVALVFRRDSVIRLLTSQHMVNKFGAVPPRNKESIDGGVITAMTQVGVKEYVHNPSLVQHIGTISVMGHPTFPQSASFLGEGFDAMDLIRARG
jgi:hypothetical protein